MRALLLAFALSFSQLCTPAQTTMNPLRIDFTNPTGRAGWQPTHDISRLSGSAEGMTITASGGDPYAVGPAYPDVPTNQPLWLRLRLRATQSGMGQVFFFADHPTEPNSVRFAVRANRLEDVRLPLPPLPPSPTGYRFRIDPPGTDGVTTVIASMEITPRVLLTEPAWPAPVHPVVTDNSPSVRAGDVELIHSPVQVNGFIVRVVGEEMAVGHTQPLLGYEKPDGRAAWMNVAERARLEVKPDGKDALLAVTRFRDDEGADWQIWQRFVAGKPNTIDVETRVSVSRERKAFFLPILMLLPGAGPSSFGQEKGQAVFAGLEYLDKNEPSSSEADIIGPESNRRVPDSVKLTLPLMAIQAKGRYIGLVWEQSPDFAALFDSPDRKFSSGGHAMGILFPGANGPQQREEGSLLPYDGQTIRAGQPLTLRASLIGGRGESVVPAVQQYVAMKGLPPLPKTGGIAEFTRLAAAGWLDSKVKEGGRYRHAYPGDFAPHPAADAAYFQEWLASQTGDKNLAARLREASKEALASVPAHDYNFAAVGHVRSPAASLVYGNVAENVERARTQGRALLTRFEKDGTVIYRPSPNRPDFGKTHFANHANGLTGQALAEVMDAAALSGDAELIREGVRLLGLFTQRYVNSAPRGAQTWEVPLHTPDILASAHLARAYTRGYEFTGDAAFLEQARYWAWTGVPFVYLVNPTEEAIGLYATIAVYGATHWVAPNWMGLPVQWCGLVYADALYQLARHDASGPWKRIADGIAVSGIQQTWPVGSNRERQGLLPDSLTPRAQTRNDVAINPGTVQAPASRLFGFPVYDFRAARTGGNNPLLIHAPGEITLREATSTRLRFTVGGWPPRPYYILVSGLKAIPESVRVNGRQLPPPDWEYREKDGWLVLRVEGKPEIEIASAGR